MEGGMKEDLFVLWSGMGCDAKDGWKGTRASAVCLGVVVFCFFCREMYELLYLVIYELLLF